ncbi:MAG: DMT family transporter [Burkholderiaceae bacterium]
MSDSEATPADSRARRGMRRVSGLDPRCAACSGNGGRILLCQSEHDHAPDEHRTAADRVDVPALQHGPVGDAAADVQQGLGTFKTNTLRGQLSRGLAHSLGLAFWFTALPMLPLSYTTALGFTGPIFIMLGAVLFLGERMQAARWLAAIGGFVGVLIIVWPKLTGGADLTYSLIMMASAPMFAGSFLIAKALTRHDKPSVIVAWQGLTVSLFAAPFAFWSGSGRRWSSGSGSSWAARWAVSATGA